MMTRSVAQFRHTVAGVFKVIINSITYTMRTRILALLFMVPLTSCGEQASELTPSFCNEIPRAGWAAYDKQSLSNDWFHVYKLNDDLYAITEPFQWQEVISYLIIGKEKALLFDSGNGLGDIRAIVDQITVLPVTVLASHSHIDHVGGHWQFDTVLAPDTPYTNHRAMGQNNSFVREK